MKILLVIIALLCASPAWGVGTTYTVAKTGTDQASCVTTPPTTKCLTIQYVFDNVDLTGPDIVEVEAGTYSETVTPGANDSGTTGLHVTLRAKSGDTVIIDGADTRNIGINLSDLSYFTVGGSSGCGFTFTGNMATAVYSKADSTTDLTISYNTITLTFGGAYASARKGIMILANTAGGPGTDNVIIEYNTITIPAGTFTTSDTDGITITGGNNGFIRYNTITNNLTGNDANNHTDGIQCQDSWNTTVHSNTINMKTNLTSYMQGIYMEYYNYTSDVTPDDYGWVKVYNNLVYGNAAGVLVQIYARPATWEPYSKAEPSIIDVEVYNNTISADVYLPFKAYNPKTLIMKNNIFISKDYQYCYGSYNVEGTHTTSSAVVDYNHCYPKAGTLEADDILEISLLAQPARNLLTWAEAQAAGYETHGIGYSGGWVDPSLSASYTPDAAGDPAVNAGTSISTVFILDRNGKTRPVGTSWDIGAFEYGSLAFTIGSGAGMTIGSGAGFTIQ